jgi:hypothetical protein
LHHLYRAMAWLGEILPQDPQDGAEPSAPRTNRAPTRISSRKSCSRGSVTCSPIWPSCSSTPSRSTPRGQEARPSVSAGTHAHLHRASYVKGPTNPSPISETPPDANRTLRSHCGATGGTGLLACRLTGVRRNEAPKLWRPAAGRTDRVEKPTLRLHFIRNSFASGEFFREISRPRALGNRPCRPASLCALDQPP